MSDESSDVRLRGPFDEFQAQPDPNDPQANIRFEKIFDLSSPIITNPSSSSVHTEKTLVRLFDARTPSPLPSSEDEDTVAQLENPPDDEDILVAPMPWEEDDETQSFAAHDAQDISDQVEVLSQQINNNTILPSEANASIATIESSVNNMDPQSPARIQLQNDLVDLKAKVSAMKKKAKKRKGTLKKMATALNNNIREVAELKETIGKLKQGDNPDAEEVQPVRNTKTRYWKALERHISAIIQGKWNKDQMKSTFFDRGSSINSVTQRVINTVERFVANSLVTDYDNDIEPVDGWIDQILERHRFKLFVEFGVSMVLTNVSTTTGLGNDLKRMYGSRGYFGSSWDSGSWLRNKMREERIKLQ